MPPEVTGVFGDRRVGSSGVMLADARSEQRPDSYPRNTIMPIETRTPEISTPSLAT